MIKYVHNEVRRGVKKMANLGVDFETTRVNYNLPTKLVNRVKEYAREMGVPITYGVVLLLNKGLDSEKTLNAMTKINEMYEDYKSGKLSDIVKESSES